MKPKKAIVKTIFYLSIFVVVGIFLIILGIGEFSNSDEDEMPVIVFIIGGLFIFAGIYAIVTTAKGRVNRGDLKATGQKCSGVIIRIEPDCSITLDGRHPDKAVCHVVDSYTGETFEVRSVGYMTDLTKFMMREVDVYIDRYDRSKYFVDIEKLADTLPAVPQNTDRYDYRK